MVVRRVVFGFLLMLLVAPLAVSSTLGQEGTPESDPSPTQFPGLPLAQASYDTLRVADDGKTLPYHVWVDWVPELVTTPDGGAWAFFGAQARLGEGASSRRLFAARFDPSQGVWLPASALPGDRVQFGPVAAVDGQGDVHLVYSELGGPDTSVGSTLVYTRFGEGGTWTDPVAVAPDPAAGYQMMPALTIDGAGRVHVMWRDQRAVSAEDRASLPANADLYESTLTGDAWSPAAQVTIREAPDINAAWPLLATDGERLVAIWSLYKGTTDAELSAAANVEWSTRPADGSAGWSPAETLLAQSDDEVGGRLLDLAASESGLAIIYGRFAGSTNQLALKRLAPGTPAWGPDIPISTGDYGYLPALAISPDGDAFVAYNTRRNRNVEIGAVEVFNDDGVSEPVSLTASEDGVQARAAVAIDADGTPWVIYMHQPVGSSAATEIRSLRTVNFGDQ